LALGAVLALTVSGCGKSETSTAAPAATGSSTQGAQQLETTAPTASATTGGGTTTGSSTSGCTLTQYGVPKGLALTSLVVGFSQSEKEANPFRIAETQSSRRRPPSSVSRSSSPRTPSRRCPSRSATSRTSSPRARRL